MNLHRLPGRDYGVSGEWRGRPSGTWARLKEGSGTEAWRKGEEWVVVVVVVVGRRRESYTRKLHLPSQQGRAARMCVEKYEQQEQEQEEQEEDGGGPRALRRGRICGGPLGW